MRPTSEKTVSDELTQRVAELAARVAQLTRQVELSEGARGNGVRYPKPQPVVHDADHSANPIEFLTENGFVIVRPWEVDGSPVPAAETCRFFVSDPNNIEREIRVEISRQLIMETAIQTNGRIQSSDSFWFTCAERHLANYVMEHDDFPPENNLTVDAFDREDKLLAIRWGKST